MLNIINASDYGSVQEAIDYAETLPESNNPIMEVTQGVSILVPAGQFSGVVIKKQVSLVGQGRGATVFESITSRPGLYEVTGNTSLGSNVIANISDTSKMFVGQSISGAGIPDGQVITSIDSSTQIRISENATANGSDVTLTIQYYAKTQTLTNLAVTNLVATNETGPDSGIFNPNVLFGTINGGLQISGCWVGSLNATNIANIQIDNSETFFSSTLLNSSAEIANSILGSLVIQCDDTNPGFQGSPNVYIDESSCYGGVSFEKPAGSSSPTGLLSNCFVGNLSNTGGGEVTLLGHGFNPASPSDWNTAPTESAAALNELAARVKALESK